MRFWTLSVDDLRVVGARRGALRWGFLLQLRPFARFGRYERRTDFASEVIAHVAAQIEVGASLSASFGALQAGPGIDAVSPFLDSSARHSPV